MSHAINPLLIDEDNPPSREERNCSRCGKAMILLPTHWKGDRWGRMPCNAETVEPEDTRYIHRKHISHFSDCPHAEKFRTPKQKKEGQ